MLKHVQIFSAVLLAGLATLCAVRNAGAQAKDLTANYTWKPVRIGAGGFVVGMTLHPLDSTVRYARTDVGNGYRWDNVAQSWIAMRVLNSDGSGVQSTAETYAPSGYGIDSIAVDPTNTTLVYMVFPTVHSCDVQCPTNYVQLYKSTDGGQNFLPGGLGAAAIKGNPNGPNRTDGERLVIDAKNTQSLYYGSDSQGLLRSLDGGATWTPYAATTGLPTNVEFINIQIAAHGGTVQVGTATLSKVVYAISIQNSGDAGGDVYQSTDGGQTWTDISTGITDAVSGVVWSHQAAASSLGSDDTLYVVENPSTNGYHRAFWKYAAGKWARVSLEGAAGNSINQPLTSVVADPVTVNRLYAMGVDTSMSRSDDGGVTWTSFGEPLYANTFSWLPQTVGMNGGDWHSNGCLRFDAKGNLWTPTGQEGPLTMTNAAGAAGTATAAPKWTISATGIEEQVSQDIIIPQGSGDTMIAAAEDTTGFVIKNPDNFTAVQIPLQNETIAQGTAVDTAPDAPTYIAITSSNVYTNGPNYSGYSSDGGSTWKRFGPALQYACTATTKCDVPAGTIAVGVRGTRTLGSDHIVLLPPYDFVPEYSTDGGATWSVTQSFPLTANGLQLDTSTGAYNGFYLPELHQHLLRADPFVADRFYLKWLHAPASIYVSVDGGQTWTAQPNAVLPDDAFHGQLVVNTKVKNDLWYADGWEGSTVHGVFHSTDGGATFTQIAGISHAVVIAVGAGSGRAGDAAYSVYFYGEMATNAAWGVFQSTNGGQTWNRIAYYPLGIYDRPNTMAASQDTFGKTYLGWSGDSFAYSQYIAPAPAAPTSLSASGVTSAEIDLAWTAPAGTVSGYVVYRGLAAGAESAAPLSSSITGMTYADKAVTSATRYFYTVAASNAGSVGPASNEASAVATQPSLGLAPAAGSSASQTVTGGQTATFALVLTSTNVSATVTFACTGVPAGQTCTSPAALTLTPATTATTVNFNVTTSALAANHFELRGKLPEGLILSAFVFSFLLRRKRVRSLLLLTAVTGFWLAGCSGHAAKTPVQVNLVVTAAAQNVVTASQALTLVVQ